MIEVSDFDTFNYIISSNEVVIAKFHATWCGPCKNYGATFHTVSANYDESIPFISIDVDMVPQVVAKYSIKSIPLTIKFINGNAENMHKGPMNEQELNRFAN